MESESAPSSRFRELLQEVAAGVPDAAEKIVSEYGGLYPPDKAYLTVLLSAVSSRHR